MIIKNYNNAMTHAAEHDHIDIIKLMVENGSDNYNEIMGIGVMFCKIDIVRQGVDKLAVFDEHGPLTFSLAKESIEIAKNSVATQSEYYQASFLSLL